MKPYEEMKKLTIVAEAVLAGVITNEELFAQTAEDVPEAWFKDLYDKLAGTIGDVRVTDGEITKDELEKMYGDSFRPNKRLDSAFRKVIHPPHPAVAESTRKKTCLEDEINRLVADFQDATGLQVQGIIRKPLKAPTGEFLPSGKFTISAILP